MSGILRCHQVASSEISRVPHYQKGFTMLRNFRRVRRHHRKLWKGHVAEIQQLEQRALLAGTVLVTFASNVATITGDNKSNSIDVDVDAGGVITITGQEGTKVSFGGVVRDAEDPLVLPSPTAALGINVSLRGGSDAINLNVSGGLGTLPLKNLTVDMGDEEDEVSILVGEGTTLNFADVINISTGEGGDELDIQIDGVVNVAKTLTLNTGADDDDGELQVDGTLTVKGAVSILTGDGEDFFDISGNGTVRFDNALTINTGEDSDELGIELDQGLTVIGAVTITTGDGDDRISFSHSESTLDFRKGLSIDTGSGRDEVDLSSSDGILSSGADLKISTGSGDDEVRINERLQLNAGLTITTGDGMDRVELFTGTGFSPDLALTESPVENLIKGKLTIDTGDDADQVNFSIDSETSLTVNAAASIATGRGDDDVFVFLDETIATFKAGLSIDTGATAASSSGRDEVFIEGGRINVTGVLKIATGALSDFVGIFSTLAVTGDVGIQTGTGNDGIAVILGSDALPEATGPVNTLGSLTIDSGSGSDDVTFGNEEDATARIAGNVSITTGSGEDFIEVFVDANLTIVKDLKFDTGTGDDHLLVQAFLGSIHVNGSQSVILGDDDDCFIQGTTTAIDPFRPEGSPVVGEGNPDATFRIDTNLTVLGGTGHDLIGLAGIQVGKDKPTPTAAFPASVTTIDSGAGDDVIGASDTIFRDLKVLAGDGNDVVGGQSVTIRGTTNIDLGAGNDQLAIDGETTLHENVTLAGGTGDDEFAVGEDVTLNAGKKVALNGGAGTDIVANASAIPQTAFNPLPAGIEDLDGEVDTEAIQETLIALFQDCLSEFEDFEE